MVNWKERVRFEETKERIQDTKNYLRKNKIIKLQVDMIEIKPETTAILSIKEVVRLSTSDGKLVCPNDTRQFEIAVE